MNRSIQLLVLALIHLVTLTASADHTHHSLKLDIETQLTQFKLDEAQLLLGEFENQAFGAFYQTQILIYKYLASQQASYMNELESQWNQHIETITENTKGRQGKEILLSDLYCKRAMLEFLDENYFGAIRYARLGRKYIKTSQEKYGDLVDQMKIRGLFNVMLGAIPAKYQWISRTLGFEGDIQKGIRQLQHSAAKGMLLTMESQLLLCFVEKNMLGQPETAIQRLHKLRKAQPASILIEFILASTYMQTRQNTEGASYIRKAE